MHLFSPRFLSSNSCRHTPRYVQLFLSLPYGLRVTDISGEVANVTPVFNCHVTFLFSRGGRLRIWFYFMYGHGKLSCGTERCFYLIFSACRTVCRKRDRLRSKATSRIAISRRWSKFIIGKHRRADRHTDRWGNNN